ncbi:MAG: hypothetical protein RIC87_22155 [Kiloniellales bacterium]
MEQSGAQEKAKPLEAAGGSAARMPLIADSAAFAEGLEKVKARGFADLPLLAAAECAQILKGCEDLPYRRARPLVGSAGREVHQDFDLTFEIPRPHPICDLAASLDRVVCAAADMLDPSPLPEGIVFNDLIVQRYPAGSQGITPHRDHLRYTGLVILVTLTGRAGFYVCADRSGADAVEIPAPPGGAILLAAPGFADGSVRPFHFLDRVSAPRISLGFRQDTRPGEPT